MAITVSPERSYPSTASNAALNGVLRLAFRCLTAYKLVACAATCVVRKLFLPPIEWCCDACLTYMSRITPHAYWIIIYVQIACLNLLCVNTAIGMTNMYVSVVSDDLQWGMPICVGECSVIDFATAASRRSSRCNMSDAVLPLPHTAKTSRTRYRRFFYFLPMSSEIIHIVFGSFRRMNGVFLLLGAGFLCFLINYHGGLGCFLLPLIMRINASGDNTLVFNLPRFVLALDWKPLTQFRIQVDSWYLIYVNYLIPQHLIPPNLCLTLHGTFTWIRRLFACGPEAFTLHTHLRPSE